MEVTRPDLIPDPCMDRSVMKEVQLSVANTATFSGSINGHDEVVVVGVDQAFHDDHAVSVALAMKNGEVIEEASASMPVQTPYVPGLLSFREGEAVIEALRELCVEPDLLMFDGSGRIHYRQAGIATHIGVVFDTPSIGVAKNLLCGETDVDDEMPVGETRLVTAGDNVVNASNDEVIGAAYQSRQYATGNQSINPLYVSSGHRVDLDDALTWVSSLCGTRKLPDPIHRADRRVSAQKSSLV